jgi:hypothetical protein
MKAFWGGLPGGDVVPVKLVIISELQDRVRGELSSVIADNRLGLAASIEQRREFTPAPCA